MDALKRRSEKKKRHGIDGIEFVVVFGISTDAVAPLTEFPAA
jgi:hypothetical protein